VDGRFVTVGGVDLFVREGRGEGHPLLLLNGIGSNTDMWGSLEDRLSGVARTIVVDAPGSGRSSTPPLPLSISEIAELVRALIDDLGHEQVDMLGYSFGGLVAQELARRDAARVRRMALVGTACGWGSRPGTFASCTSGRTDS
jgi:pimeloyl-ACP methyl ester carboxylesterase